ncbi:MAG: hypothetical protein GC204_20535 [Chloroflexi bacterium]|nr:hypothetical protein [Chloroflexota bacterium]
MANAEKFKTIDDYIRSFPPEVRGVLQTLRETIKEEAPEAEETIKYDMPTFVWHGNLVYFAAWKKHISLYPITHTMEDAIREISDYKNSGKGTIQFPLDQPLPLPLIRRIVQFRVQEQQEKRR